MLIDWIIHSIHSLYLVYTKISKKFRIHIYTFIVEKGSSRDKNG